MSDLSLLVRLNETIDVRPPSVPAGGGPQSMPNVLLLVSDVGEGSIFTGSFSEKKTFFMTTPVKEVHRDSVKKRIRNPDDPDQHVDVLDVKRLKAKSGSGQQYQKQVFLYNTGSNRQPGDEDPDTVDGQPVEPGGTGEEPDEGGG